MQAVGKQVFLLLLATLGHTTSLAFGEIPFPLWLLHLHYHSGEISIWDPFKGPFHREQFSP